MRYPGIWFGFDEDGMLGHAGIPTHMAQSPEERNQEVKRIVVTQRTDADDQVAQEKDALDEATECPEMYGDLKKAYVKARMVYFSFQGQWLTRVDDVARPRDRLLYD